MDKTDCTYFNLYGKKHQSFGISHTNKILQLFKRNLPTICLNKTIYSLSKISSGYIFS